MLKIMFIWCVLVLLGWFLFLRYRIWRINRYLRNDLDRITSQQGLQVRLRQFLQLGHPCRTLFVKDVRTDFLMRVVRSNRKRSPNTLTLEVRNSDATAKWYLGVRRVLQEQGLEYIEKLTPKRRQPKHFRMRHQQGGPLAVSFISHMVATIHRAIHGDVDMHYLVATYEPASERNPTS